LKLGDGKGGRRGFSILNWGKFDTLEEVRFSGKREVEWLRYSRGQRAYNNSKENYMFSHRKPLLPKGKRNTRFEGDMGSVNDCRRGD